MGSQGDKFAILIKIHKTYQGRLGEHNFEGSLSEASNLKRGS